MTGSQNTRKHFDRTFQSKCNSSCISKNQFYNLVSVFGNICNTKPGQEIWTGPWESPARWVNHWPLNLQPEGATLTRWWLLHHFSPPKAAPAHAVSSNASKSPKVSGRSASINCTRYARSVMPLTVTQEQDDRSCAAWKAMGGSRWQFERLLWFHLQV